LKLETLLQHTGHSSPTEMQASYWKETNPFSILLAHTGSGKTLAFLIQLEKHLSEKHESVLILCPTRELALQVFTSYVSLKTGRKSVCCYGGHSFKNEQLQLQEKPAIIVGTPGRILDHYQRNTPGIGAFSNLILDEYDKTLEMGFLPTITEISAFASPLNSIQLVSATEINELPPLFSGITFQTCHFLQVEKPQHHYFSLAAPGHDKLFALVSFLSSKSFGPVLIFCSHREAANRISQQLSDHGKANAEFHGGMEQVERERALIKFKHGSVDCLVCTDLAARGLDIPEIDAIFHYQFPHTLADFIHRNGRTARMQKEGQVYLLHSENEMLPSYASELAIKAVRAPTELSDFKGQEKITYYLSAGRKNKLRKVDIVGFFLQEAGLTPTELGLIDVFDSYSFVTIDASKKNEIKALFPRVRIKKQAVLISYCR